MRPGQNGPGSDAGSSSNSPALGGIKREGGEGPSAMQLSGGGGGGGAASSSGGAPDDQSRDQDRLLPIANISRLMKRVLPDHAKMSKEAKAALQESVSEFIGFITSEASDRLVEEKRKTITGDDSQDTRTLTAREHDGWEHQTAMHPARAAFSNPHALRALACVLSLSIPLRCVRRPLLSSHRFDACPRFRQLHGVPDLLPQEIQTEHQSEQRWWGHQE